MPTTFRWSMVNFHRWQSESQGFTSKFRGEVSI